MNRRAFLALFGCGVIGLKTDWSGALSQFEHGLGTTLAPLPTGRMLIEEINFSDRALSAPAWVTFAVRGNPMIRSGLWPGTYSRWVAAPGCEIVMREQDRDVHLDGERAHDIDWNFMWRLEEKCASVSGCEYCGRAFYVWPAGGHCLSCGGALPAPLVGDSRFLTSMCGGVRTVLPMAVLQQSTDRSCDYCGAQIAGDRCVSCGAEPCSS